MLRCLVLVVTTGCFIKPDPPGIAGEAGVHDDTGSQDGPNIVFVTSGVFLPNTPATNLTRADTFCNLSAHQATPPIPGNFVAWLSGNGVGESAIERLRAHNPRGWKLVDGEPFADTVDDIANLQLLGTPHIDENGGEVVHPGSTVNVVTGSDDHGNDMVGADALCSQGRIEIGHPNFVDATWTAVGYLFCSDTTMRLYCFQYDHNVPVP